MPDRLTPAQIRGARGMLDWSRFDLAAAAEMSVSTVKRAEDKTAVPISDGIQGAIRGALENKGVYFIPDDGNGPGVTLWES